MKINFVDLSRQYIKYQPDIDAQIRTVIKETAFIMGKEVKELEKQLASYVGTRHAVGCGSGTDALQLALMAHGIKPGDEIITTPFTFIATAEVISLLRAKPVFVDVRRDTFNIDPNLIAKAITPQTRGIIAVDVFGQCADYDEINTIAKKHKLFVIEDAAQSFGGQYKEKRACSLSEIGCTSFFPAKPLGCYGDGGMIFLNDDTMAGALKSLRSHGSGNHKYENIRIGINSRLDTLQAGILLAKFKHFAREIELRNQVADYYTKNLKNTVETPVILPHNRSVYAQYNIIVKNRDMIEKALKEKEIPTAIYYPTPLHLQPAYVSLSHKQGDFPITEHICQHILSLPIHPFLSHKEQDFIVNAVKESLP